MPPADRCRTPLQPTEFAPARKPARVQLLPGLSMGGQSAMRYIFNTRMRVGVTSTLTPSRLRRNATNESVSFAEKTPLILSARNAPVSISIGVAL